MTREDTVQLYLDWPAASVTGQVVDVSPTGMRCETAAPLDLNDVVKIAAEHFDAIGSVAHTQRTDGISNSGMRFLSVRFPRTLGNFMSLKV